MKDTFSLDRFGKVLVSDLKMIWEKYSITGIILASVPIILFLGSGIINVCQGSGFFSEMDMPSQFIIGILELVFVLSFPSKTYGALTERRAGSQWLMLPSSGFEKSLSMFLSAVVICPLVLYGLWRVEFLLLDLIPGVSITVESFSQIKCFAFVDALSFFASTGLFLLGAVLFKKNKVAKTILCILGFFIVLGFVFGFIAGKTGSVNEILEQFTYLKQQGDETIVTEVINIATKIIGKIGIVYVILTVLEYVAIHFRMKKLHF